MNIPAAKFFWLLLTGFFLLPAAALAGNTHDDEVEMQLLAQEMDATATAIKQYSVEQREQALLQIKTTLNKFDAQIAHLEQQLRKRAGLMDKRAYDKASATLLKIKDHREQVAEWYDNMHNSTAATWQNVKRGFLKSYVALQEAFDKVQKEP